MRDWLAHRARVTPGATAVVTAGPVGAPEAPDSPGRREPSPGTELAYADLDARVEELAGRLAALGIGVEDHLGVLLGTRVASVELAHAAMRLGAVLVPLNVRLTPGELAVRVDRVDLDLLVCGAETASPAAEAAAEAAAGVPVASVDPPESEGSAGRTSPGVDALAAGDPAAFDLPAWDSDSPLLLAFTSGTTGRPKAVSLSMGNVRASATASAFRLGVDPGDRWHVPLPTYHVGGLAPVYRSTLYGTAVVVQEGFDAAGTLAAMRDHGATCVSLVPTMLRRMLDAGGTDDAGDGPAAVLSELRFVLLGGAPAPRELVERCADRGVPVCPTYGATETASQVATATPAQAAADPDTVGNPLLFTDVSVLDEEGAPVPDGEPGELVVSGPTVMRGYYGDPERTAAVLGAEGFHTGDVGYREGGRLYVLNRLDDRITTGGENVDPGEVVAALREHPSVEDAAVVGLDDEEWGQRVAALVVRSDTLTREALDAHCRERLAGFKRPRTVGFADALPRTASGTVDRAAVRERLRTE